LEDVKQKLELLLQEEKQALRDEEIGKDIVYLIYITIYFVELYKLNIYYSTKFASKSITRRMGEKRAIGKVAAGTARVVRNGENEKTRV